jgi:hypothetical protein
VWIPWIIVSWDPTMFDQTFGFGFSNQPNGKWGHYGIVVADSTYGKKMIASRVPCSTATFITGTNDGPAGANLGVG